MAGHSQKTVVYTQEYHLLDNDAPKSTAFYQNELEKDTDDNPSSTISKETNLRERKQTSTMHLNDNKAGMQGLDTAKINKIIEDASRGSKFYQHKQQRQRRIDERIGRLLERRASLTTGELEAAEAEMAELSAQLELRRDLSRFVVHVDMDAFYAAVEIRDRPELRDVPMAVGSMGMLSTSNYAARRFGIRSAMPGFIGKKLCPRLVIVPCNFDKYRAASEQVQQVLARYDPNFSMASLDEAYLDISECVHRHLSEAQETDGDKNPDEMACMLVSRMRADVQNATGLTASAGIACNGMLAKICSDRNKPNGQFFLPRDRSSVLEFLRVLPCRKVGGIGDVTAQMLAALDINSCGDLLQRRSLLRLLFSESSCLSLLSAGLGVRGDDDDDGDDERRHQKSVSTETTFPDTANREELLTVLEELCSQLAEDVVRKQLQGRTLTVKVKTATFEIRQRSRTLSEATSRAETMLAVARALFVREAASGEPLRLLGVRLSSLSEAPEDGTLQPRQTTLDKLFGKGPLASGKSGSETQPAPATKERRTPCGPRQVTLSEMASHSRAPCKEGISSDLVSSLPQNRVRIELDVSATKMTSPRGGCTGGDVKDSPRGAMMSAAGPQYDQCRIPLSEGRVAPDTQLSDRIASVDTFSALERKGHGSGISVDTSDEHSVCPVCAKCLPSSLVDVNRHLDLCLNQQLLLEMTGGGETRGMKRAAPKPVSIGRVKHKRIESFFTKK